MTHFTGMILSAIRKAVHAAPGYPTDDDVIAIDNSQQNGSFGVHQARVHLANDPTTYRLILAPADAPITINGRPIGEHFSLPLETDQ